MKVRLIAVFIRNDITYEVQILTGEKWVTARCFDATQLHMAIGYANNMKLIDVNKYDACMKFPNTVIEVNDE